MRFNWDKTNLEENIFCWQNSVLLSNEIPIATFWEVWRARNYFIFQKGHTDAFHVSIKVLSRLKDHGCVSLKSHSRIISHPFVDCYQVTSFFHRDEQKGFCGVGMVITLQINHLYLLRMVMRNGTNTTDELLALWGLLWFAQKKNIHSLQVLSDSKAIVDWEKHVHHIHSLELYG